MPDVGGDGLTNGLPAEEILNEGYRGWMMKDAPPSASATVTSGKVAAVVAAAISGFWASSFGLESFLPVGTTLYFDWEPTELLRLHLQTPTRVPSRYTVVLHV